MRSTSKPGGQTDCNSPPVFPPSWVLIYCSVPCALYFTGKALFGMYVTSAAGQAGSALLGGVTGMLGVMSLMESYKIYNLIKAKRVHTHPLFVGARTWRRTRRDGQGRFHTINTSHDDDDDEDEEAPSSGRASCYSCCTRLIPWWRAPEGDITAELLPPGRPATEAELRRQEQQRAQRVVGTLGYCTYIVRYICTNNVRISVR